ncbi:MAG TPA: hypothetical protein PLZ54_07895 [Paludibacteraceae bacterium]|jgi:hypothetical protein|nr:hypothetical protein [Paludibacteraceae bacterium]
MKKEEIKLSLILVVGGLGMIFCLFFLQCGLRGDSKLYYSKSS